MNRKESTVVCYDNTASKYKEKMDTTLKKKKKKRKRGEKKKENEPKETMIIFPMLMDIFFGTIKLLKQTSHTKGNQDLTVADKKRITKERILSANRVKMLSEWRRH